MNTAHSEFSPSRLAYIATCAGYISRPTSENEQEEIFSPASVGTRIHEAFELEDPSKLLTPTEIRIYEKAFELEKDAIKWVEEQGHTVLEIQKEFPYQGISFEGLEEVQRGTADRRIILSDNTVMIVDLKTGQNEVPPAWDNVQLMAYAMMEFAQFPETQKVFLCINQPTVDIDSCLSFGVIYRDKKEGELCKEEGMRRIEAIIANTRMNQNNKFSYCAEPNTCMYCARLGHCNAVAKLAYASAKSRLSPDVVAQLPIQDMSELDWMDKANLAGLTLHIIRLLKKSDDSFRDTVKEYLEMGVEVPRWKLGNGGTRNTYDQSRLKKYVLEHLTSEELLNYIKTIPTDAVKATYAKLKESYDGITWEDFIQTLTQQKIVTETKSMTKLLADPRSK